MRYETVSSDKNIERLLPPMIKSEIKMRNIIHILGKRKSAIVTFATIELIPERRIAFLKYIYVTPEYRRLHYGLELFEEVRKDLALRGIKLVVVDLKGDDDMISMSDPFLESAGFTIEDAADGIRLWSYSI